MIDENPAPLALLLADQIEQSGRHIAAADTLRRQYALLELALAAIDELLYACTDSAGHLGESAMHAILREMER